MNRILLLLWPHYQCINNNLSLPISEVLTFENSISYIHNSINKEINTNPLVSLDHHWKIKLDKFIASKMAYIKKITMKIYIKFYIKIYLYITIFFSIIIPALIIYVFFIADNDELNNNNLYIDYQGKISVQDENSLYTLYEINKSSDKNFLKLMYDSDDNSRSLVNCYIYKNYNNFYNFLDKPLYEEVVNKLNNNINPNKFPRKDLVDITKDDIKSMDINEKNIYDTYDFCGKKNIEQLIINKINKLWNLYENWKNADNIHRWEPYKKLKIFHWENIKYLPPLFIVEPLLLSPSIDKNDKKFYLSNNITTTSENNEYLQYIQSIIKKYYSADGIKKFYYKNGLESMVDMDLFYGIVIREAINFNIFSNDLWDFMEIISIQLNNLSLRNPIYSIIHFINYIDKKKINPLKKIINNILIYEIYYNKRLLVSNDIILTFQESIAKKITIYNPHNYLFKSPDRFDDEAMAVTQKIENIIKKLGDNLNNFKDDQNKIAMVYFLLILLNPHLELWPNETIKNYIERDITMIFDKIADWNDNHMAIIKNYFIAIIPDIKNNTTIIEKEKLEFNNFILQREEIIE